MKLYLLRPRSISSLPCEVYLLRSEKYIGFGQLFKVGLWDFLFVDCRFQNGKAVGITAGQIVEAVFQQPFRFLPDADAVCVHQ